MKLIELFILSSEEALLGLRFNSYNFCEEKDENGFLIVEYFQISLGLIFLGLRLNIEKGRFYH